MGALLQRQNISLLHLKFQTVQNRIFYLFIYFFLWERHLNRDLYILYINHCCFTVCRTWIVELLKIEEEVCLASMRYCI
jgi:hypothetical protein